MVLIVMGLISFLQFMYPIVRIEDVFNQLQLSILFTFFMFFHPKLSLPLPGLKHYQKKQKAVFFLRSAPPCAILEVVPKWSYVA